MDTLDSAQLKARVKEWPALADAVRGAEFSPGKGINPSVENIAKVCYDLLAPAIARHPGGARLTCVTVWETDKTSCTFPG